jgi:hypothetical protein
VPDLKRKEYPLDEYTLYSSKPEKMEVYKVKSAILDFYLFLAVLGYIGALWATVKYLGNVRFTGPVVSSSKPKTR